MYELVVDNEDGNTNHLSFPINQNPNYWYEKCIELGVDSLALWNEDQLLKFYIKQEVNTDE